MSHHPDESGSAPEDGLLARPYGAPSGRPYRTTTPAWPHTGPVSASFRAPEGRSEDPEHAAAADAAPADAAVRRDRGGRLPLAVLALLALGAAGGLVFLLSGPDPRPERAVAPPDLSLPALPARRPGVDAEPSPERSVRPSAPSASASASGGPSASRTPKPTPPPSASAGQPPAGSSGTLRMGDRGPEVSALQERLYGQGFTYVAVTGVYDSQTRRGVAQLQRDRDIKGDQPGVYGPATQAAFGG